MEQVPMSRKKINEYGNFVSTKENGNFTKKKKMMQVIRKLGKLTCNAITTKRNPTIERKKNWLTFRRFF